jgi:hypothetical protein
MIGGPLAIGLTVLLVVALVRDSNRPPPSITYINSDGEEVTTLIGSVRHTDPASLERRMKRKTRNSHVPH